MTPSAIISVYLLAVLICAGWSAVVVAHRYGTLSPVDLRSCTSGLIVIAFICPPLAVIAAYFYADPLPAK